MKKMVMLLLVSSASVWSSQWIPATPHEKIECGFRKLERQRLQNVTVTPGVSTNWSGYVTATNLSNPLNDSVESVLGSWKVPQLSSQNTNGTYSSIWVGIDGYTDGSVEQLGTEQDWVNGTQQNYAWFEMYPQGSYEITGFPVDVNDQISAEVLFQAPHTYILTMWNHTKNVYIEIPTTYTKSTTALRKCAEWIVEAPATSSGILPLTHFDPIEFTNCQVTIQNRTATLNQHLWPLLQLNMENGQGILRAVTSALSSDTFTVNWEHE